MNAATQQNAFRELRDTETEQALLGLLMSGTGHIDMALAAGLEVEHFAEPAHQAIADIAFRLKAAGKSVDPLSVSRALGADMLKAIGGHEYLVDLLAVPPLVTADAAKSLADMVVEYARRRRVVAVCRETIAAARDLAPEGSAARLADETTRALFDLNASGRPSETVSGGAAAAAAVASAWDARVAGRPPGLRLGLEDLDAAIGGLQSGDMIVLGGRTGMGKSAVAINFAYNVATSGVGVLVVSCEMTAQQIGRRLASNAARDLSISVPYHNLRAGRIDDAQKTICDQAVAGMANLPLEIDDRRKPSMTQIIGSAKQTERLFARRGIRLGLIVVDHLQLIAAPREYRGNRVAEVTENSGDLKALARDMGVPVLVCSQLNRDLEGRDVKDKRPTLRDLRDSGAIEQDADVVMLLFREEYYHLAKRPDRFREPAAFDEWEPDYLRCKNRLEVIIAKNREGEPRTVTLHCDMAISAIRTWRGSA